MSRTQLLTEARALWAEIAAAPVAFPGQGINVVTSSRSRLCPPGWIGLVLLAGTGIATAPDQVDADAVVELLAGLPPARLYDQTEATKALPAAAMIGPVTLAYLDQGLFRPASAFGPAVERLPVEHPDLRALEGLCSPGERNEASIGELTSPVFAIREAGEVVAASGYALWPRRTAHLAILTAPGA